MLHLKRHHISLTEFMSGSLSTNFVTKRTRESQSETTRPQMQLLREAIEPLVEKMFSMKSPTLTSY